MWQWRRRRQQLEGLESSFEVFELHSIADMQDYDTSSAESCHC
jgi:hypothetical protein